MADQNLPPLRDEDTGETQVSRQESTRENQRAAQEDTEQNLKHRTKMVRRAGTPPPPTGHVQGRQSPPAYAPRPRRNRRAIAPKDSALYLPWWSIVIMLIGVLVVSLGVIGTIYFMGSSSPFNSNPDPIIVIVTGDPNAINSENTGARGVVGVSSTEIITGQNAATDLQLAGPTLAPVQISPTPAAIRIGSVVVVDGVDVNTLNVRSTASLTESSILFRAEEGEIFTVLDGPQQSDGFTWWQIEDPTDLNRRGWAVSNFLTVQTP